VIGIAATLISVYAAKIHRGLLVVALKLAIPTLFQRILLPKANANSFLIFNMVLSFVFDVLIIVVIFRHVFAKEQASSETIFGALCIYLLVGFSFASAHGMVAIFQPNAFYLDPRTNLHLLHLVPERFDFIYYSFATMTSLGAAGIAPVAASALRFGGRSDPRRSVPCCPDRKTDGLLPPQPQRMSNRLCLAAAATVKSGTVSHAESR
jgi:hypothetical protein